MHKRLLIIASALALAACTEQLSVNPATDATSSTGLGASSSTAAPLSADLAVAVQPQDIQKGQLIGNMEVVSNEYKEYSTTSGIRFKGKMTLTGEYWYASAEGGMGPRGMCLSSLDAQSKIGLPVRAYADAREAQAGMPPLIVRAASENDYNGDGICFDHAEAVKKGFLPGTRGTATVVIDNFFLELSGLEGKTNSASLVTVASVESKGSVERAE